MSNESYKDVYRRANQYRKTPFLDRPYFGSPGAPAQAETNVSNIWGHINGGFLIGYEYTRWWKESLALRQTAILGDWSWLNKVRVTGRDAAHFLNFATVKDISRQQVGQIMYTPMTNEDGKVAIEGLTWKFGDNDFIFTQSGAQSWLPQILQLTNFEVTLEDVTPDYTCFALQGPRATEILESLTGEDFKDMKFSRWRRTRTLSGEVIVGRQGVTGEVGYEFLMRTDTGKTHELWREIRKVGEYFGLRELGFKTQMIGHTETGIATVIRDFLPARMTGPAIRKFATLWASAEEVDVLEGDLSEHFCSPAELGWGYTINLDNHDFYGHKALARERDSGGPARKLTGLMWNSDDMAELYARLFQDGPSAPPPDLPTGQFRMSYVKVLQGKDHVGWATGVTYSPTLKRMISLARIRKDLAVADTELSVIWGGFSDEPTQVIRARVHKLPFIRQHRKDDLIGGVAN